MGAFIFLILFLIVNFQSSTISASFPATNSSDCDPDIRYPFHMKGQQHQYEALPGFELLCKDNITTIHFPSYGELVVKSISYNMKKIDLLDPKNCAHRVLLNLNLSFTPFHYYYVVKNYTYLNCSISLSHPFTEVPCLSGSGHHVYTVDPALPLPQGSCERVKTVAIPFGYSPYLSDNSLGLRLTWDSSQSQESKARDSHTARITVLGFSICVVAALAILIISIKIHHGFARNQKEQLLQGLEHI